jgi:hypothetical protein
VEEEVLICPWLKMIPEAVADHLQTTPHNHRPSGVSSGGKVSIRSAFLKQYHVPQSYDVMLKWDQAFGIGVYVWVSTAHHQRCRWLADSSI